MLQQAAVQEAVAEEELINLLSRMLVLGLLVKAAMVQQVFGIIGAAAEAAQEPPVPFLLAVTDLQVLLQEHLSLTLAVVVQAVTRHLALAVQAVVAQVVLTQTRLQVVEPIWVAAAVAVAKKTPALLLLLLVVVQVVAGLLS